MKYIKIVGLCLVALFAMSAVTAATASAAAETAEFVSSSEETHKPDFSSKSGAAKFVQKNDAEITCTSDTNTGEYVNGTPKVKNVVFVLTGCKSKFMGVTNNCTTPGQAVGVIKTFKLEGELGTFGTKTGLVLKSEENKLIAEFVCGVAKVEVRGKERGTSGEKGGPIGEITPVNTLVDPGEAFKLTYTQNATNKWIQIPTELTVVRGTVVELLLESNIGGNGFELAGLETTDELFFLESLRIRRA
jgi:hypothetical protein